MCGVTGWINIDGSSISPVILKKMTDSLIHRGPDGEGHWIEGNVGLGHRRLSIIDLSPAAHQPMISSDHSHVLSYNGEIYNYKELRIELEAAGYCFRSKADSEVVLYALKHWGTEALLKFNGMFALALWDRIQQKLLLARDRYGIKPLYFAKQGRTFLFGSEQKAIIAHPDFKRELNKKALLEYFTFQNIFTDQTLLDKITLLKSGCFVELNLRDSQLVQKQYWDYNFLESFKKMDKREYLEELDRLFHQAVNRQLISDVEIGSYLSGGMDSGSITAIASKQFRNLKTFTIGFDLSSASGIELSFDERVKAEAMSARFKTEHYEMVLKAGDMERCLQTLTRHLEEPRVGQSYPNFYAAQLASKFVKVVLSGTGGDELFGGYPWRYYRFANCKNFEEYIDRYYIFWHRLINNQDIRKVFSPIWSDVKNVWTRDIFKDVFSTYENTLETSEDYINHSLYFEAKTFLHGLFVVEDKLSMAHSLENRVPFMDNDLVDFAMRCPASLKLNNIEKVVKINENKLDKYFQRSNDGKQILREIMKNYIPNDITRSEKQGFSSPDASWFKGESIEFIRNTLINGNPIIYEILDRKAVEELLNQHLEGKQNKRLLIWSLLNVNAWMNEFLQ